MLPLVSFFVVAKTRLTVRRIFAKSGDIDNVSYTIKYIKISAGFQLLTCDFSNHSNVLIIMFWGNFFVAHERINMALVGINKNTPRRASPRCAS